MLARRRRNSDNRRTQVENVITVRALEKSYGDVKAVKGIDFDVEKGSLFAFLGINGAGKSTTINMLCTLLKPDGGEAKICGHDLIRDAQIIRSKIGVVFQGSVLDKRLTVLENLTSRAAFYGIFGKDCKRRIAQLDDILGLQELLSRPYGKLSGGQRRRVDLARGLINTPQLLFLDEPTTGLDPQTRKTVWDAVQRLRAGGLSVFLTTHYMEEADGADDVVIIDGGSIAAKGTPVQLKNRYSSDYLKIYSERTAELDALVEGRDFEYESGCYKVSMRGSADAKAFLLAAEQVKDFEVVKGNMDDVFLNVTGKRLSAGGDAE